MSEEVWTKLKILIIGESGVGKSSIMLKFTEEIFHPNPTIATVGVDFKTKKLTIDGKIVQLHIWDTAGQERFCSLTRSYYRDAQGIILVYDVNNLSTLTKLKTWLDELKLQPTKPNIVKIIVGNKTDRGNRQVNSEVRKMFARNHGTLYTKVSAETAEGVQCAFEKLTRQILKTPGLRESRAPTGNVRVDRGYHPTVTQHPSSCCHLAVTTNYNN